jgi:hypothetical protein
MELLLARATGNWLRSSAQNSSHFKSDDKSRMFFKRSGVWVVADFYSLTSQLTRAFDLRFYVLKALRPLLLIAIAGSCVFL